MMKLADIDKVNHLVAALNEISALIHSAEKAEPERFVLVGGHEGVGAGHQPGQGARVAHIGQGGDVGLATRAEGETVITGALELRVKESDRISAVVQNLRNIGADATELEDGMRIVGARKPLRGSATARGRPRRTLPASRRGNRR